jgi:nicotinamidase-related amidase
MKNERNIVPTEDYLTTPSFTVVPNETALIVTDMQYASACRTEGLGKKLANEGNAHIASWRFDRVEKLLIPNIQKLLHFFRQNRLRIIYLTVGSKAPDFSDATPILLNFFKSVDNREGTRVHEILDELKPEAGEYVLNKTTNCAFASTSIDHLLRTLGMKYLVFTGVSTNMCVDTTARFAADLGYNCILIEDACSAGKEEYHRAAIITWQRLWGRLASTEEVIAELKQALQGVTKQ